MSSNDRENFIQDYCNKEERSGSTLKKGQVGCIAKGQDEGVSGWISTKGRRQGEGDSCYTDLT